MAQYARDCPRCGNPNLANNRYCAVCGATLPLQDETAPPPQNGKPGKIGKVLLRSIVLIFGILLLAVCSVFVVIPELTVTRCALHKFLG